MSESAGRAVVALVGAVLADALANGDVAEQQGRIAAMSCAGCGWRASEPSPWVSARAVRETLAGRRLECDRCGGEVAATLEFADA